jgi:Helix-turn-helix domain
MSRKLATTIKDSAIPGKYKRIAEAYAAFANNDGSNIYPSQEKLGEKAGTSPDTVQRTLADLRAATRAQLTTQASKESTHWSMRFR